MSSSDSWAGGVGLIFPGVVLEGFELLAACAGLESDLLRGEFLWSRLDKAESSSSDLAARAGLHVFIPASALTSGEESTLLFLVSKESASSDSGPRCRCVGSHVLLPASCWEPSLDGNG